MSSGRDEYMSNWAEVTQDEEEYWTRLTDNRRNEEQLAMELLRQGAARARQIGGDHYKNMGVEPWDVVDTWPTEQRIGAYRHGALKYLMRMGSKDEQLQEIKKCGHYIEKLIEVLEAS